MSREKNLERKVDKSLGLMVVKREERVKGKGFV